MITHTVTRTVARGIFANRSKVLPPIRDKLLLTLRPYAFGEDVYMDDISGNLGEDVVALWRGRYGEEISVMCAYMIPESMQTEMFAILGAGLWFDEFGVAKQVNCIELSQSPEINQWAVWYRLDYAAGLGNREVLFYDPTSLTISDYLKISAYFKAPGSLALSDAIIYYDADARGYQELTGGASDLNYSVLNPQYQLNADGTYVNVGAKPAIDFIDGSKWLRSCGAVTNLLPGGTSIARSVTLTAQPYTLQVFGAGSATCSYGTATVGTPLTFTGTAGTTTFTPSGATLWILTSTSYPVPYVPPGVTQSATNATSTGGVWFSNTDGSELWKALDGEPDGVELVTNGGFDSDTWWSKSGETTISGGVARIYSSDGAYSDLNKVGILVAGKRYLLTYDIVAAVTGDIADNNSVIMPKIVGRNTYIYKATTTTLTIKRSTTKTDIAIDNISIQCIQPQPLTLATRIRMGVGSGDLPNSASYGLLTGKAINSDVQYLTSSFSGDEKVSSYDGTSAVVTPGSIAWVRGGVLQVFTQVNTAGTQFRVGYMIEGTHTAIQWGSWVTYDGSFDPSTLYRLMLGYNNAYPMWLNRLAVWKRQVPDTELLEVLS